MLSRSESEIKRKAGFTSHEPSDRDYLDLFQSSAGEAVGEDQGRGGYASGDREAGGANAERRLPLAGTHAAYPSRSGRIWPCPART